MFSWRKETEDTSEDTVRVIWWNVLADGLDVDGGFDRIDPECLRFDKRIEGIMRVVIGMDADVFCLSEATNFGILREKFGKEGYVGVFAPKGHSPAARIATEHARERGEDAGIVCASKSDGCAMFWRPEKLRLEGLEMLSFVVPDGSGGSNQRGLVGRFQLGDKGLVVGTAHLKAKKGVENEKLRGGQISQLLQGCRRMRQPGDLAVVVGGDFNEEPHDGKVYRSICEAGEEFGGPFQSTVHFDEEEITTYKYRGDHESKRIIDYALIGAKLQLTARLTRPTSETIGPQGLPTPEIPSDHLPVGAEFRIL